MDRIDQSSRTWGLVEEWAKSQLAKAREENDSPIKTEVQTAVLRGRIKMLKDLIALPLPPKERKQRDSADDDEY